MKPGKGQLCAGQNSRSTGGTAEAGRVVREVCRRFARDVDWQHRSHIAPAGGDDPGPGWELSENHEGLHSGRYITIHLLPAMDSLLVKGGYYDQCRQPQPVYRQHLPLGEVTAQGLGRLLMEMHSGLGGRGRGRPA